MTCHEMTAMPEMRPALGERFSMRAAELLLYQLARLFSRSQLAHSDEMKETLTSRDAYATYRLGRLREILAAAGRTGVSIDDRTVIDLGCSDGAISQGYLDAGAREVIGVDIDAAAIESARATHTSPGLSFHHSSPARLPLEDQVADVMIAYDVFEHVSRPAELLEECFRVLHPGGKLLLGTWGWYHPFAPHLWSAMPVPWAHVVFSERTLLRACRRVYHSDWYQPNMHDLDEHGQRLPDKYVEESISTEYLNKFLIRDFERVFEASSFDWTLYPQPFGSKLAGWTRIFLKTPFLREFVTGYFWAVLTRPESLADQMQSRRQHASRRPELASAHS